MFLDKQRAVAETALIKATIIYKKHNLIPLSQNELQYVIEWVKLSS